MTFGFRSLLFASVLGFTSIVPAPLRAQDIATELQAIRKLVEQQNDQIARLTAEVARLSALVDAPRSATQPGHGATPGVGAAPSPAPAVVAEATRPAVVPPANVHIVVKGDSLDKIAKMHGIMVTDIQKLNKITDPKKLQIGQQLILPANAVKQEPAPAPAATPTSPGPAAPASPAPGQ